MLAWERQLAASTKDGGCGFVSSAFWLQKKCWSAQQAYWMAISTDEMDNYHICSSKPNKLSDIMASLFFCDVEGAAVPLEWEGMA